MDTINISTYQYRMLDDHLVIEKYDDDCEYVVGEFERYGDIPVFRMRRSQPILVDLELNQAINAILLRMESGLSPKNVVNGTVIWKEEAQ